MIRSKITRKLVWAFLIVFLAMNVIASFHAWKFTHFTNDDVTKTLSPEKLTIFSKLQTVLFGINNPRPENTRFPSQKFETIRLQSNKAIECWSIKTRDAKGTVILFHGYSANKSMLLEQSDEFLRLGYNTLLVDFMGSGGSEGNQTTIGFKEAEEVKTAYDYLVKKGESRIYLHGSSLGAVAILKAIHDDQLNPTGIVIECPFGSMYQTTCARFHLMHVPTFPMAGLLTFWGGLQNGFWAFGHVPTEYAKAVKCPTLLLYGELDDKVSRNEIDAIYKNLSCQKELKTYPLAAHENYLAKCKKQWIGDVEGFLKSD